MQEREKIRSCVRTERRPVHTPLRINKAFFLFSKLSTTNQFRESLKKMPEETITIDYVMEKASGPHFSGLRLDGLLSSPLVSSTSSPSHLRSSFSSAPAFADGNAPKQPFVIGKTSSLLSFCFYYYVSLLYCSLKFLHDFLFGSY